jgi:hypothetical protein
MNQFFVGNTLINDAYLGSIRVDDIVTQPYLEIDYLVQAPGGGGGATTISGRNGGAGGAGGLITGSTLLFQSATSYQVIIGEPGAGSTEDSGIAGQSGENTSLIGGKLNLVSIGGGGGGATLSTAGTQRNGKNGGCGGGGGATTGSAGFGTFGQGKDGDIGGTISGSGGGGVATSGNGPTGGSGATWLNGTLFGPGGNVNDSSTTNIYGKGGNSFSNGGLDGKFGTVIIRYPGTGSKATGGKIFYSASYTYHQFFEFGGVYTATSSFVY